MARKTEHCFFYGWLIVGVLALSTLLAYATRSSFTVFYVAILDEFGWTRADTAGIFSLSLIVYGLGGILAGYLLDKLGPRNLFPMAATLIALGALWCSQATQIWEFYVAFGLILGFGQCSLGYVPTMTVVNHWFVKCRGLAAGIAMFGLSLSYVLSPLTQYMRETIGWRAAFMVFGAAVFVIVVPMTSLFMRHRPQDMGLLPYGLKHEMESRSGTKKEKDASIVDHEWVSIEWTLLRAFRTYHLWLLLIAALVWGVMVNFPQVHQVAYITDIGYSPMFAATVFSTFGILTGIGPLGGLLSDHIGREWNVTLGATSIIIGVALALSIRGTNMEWVWYGSSISYGFGIGLIVPTLPAIYGELFGGKNLGSIIGFINVGFGIGGAVGPYLAGYIYDITKSYTPAFIMIIAAALIQTTLVALVAPRKVRLAGGRISK